MRVCDCQYVVQCVAVIWRAGVVCGEQGCGVAVYGEQGCGAGRVAVCGVQGCGVAVRG